MICGLNAKECHAFVPESKQTAILYKALSAAVVGLCPAFTPLWRQNGGFYEGCCMEKPEIYEGFFSLSFWNKKRGLIKVLSAH